ncbi:uncharacterized protein [Nothobranchius furzeri]|uniref:uncharacterized protein isoform X1 n=1 Tax=Nothobranchius furzeri TaxID=105023 RepID=UPI003904BD93
MKALSVTWQLWVIRSAFLIGTRTRVVSGDTFFMVLVTPPQPFLISDQRGAFLFTVDGGQNLTPEDCLSFGFLSTSLDTDLYSRIWIFNTRTLSPPSITHLSSHPLPHPPGRPASLHLCSLSCASPALYLSLLQPTHTPTTMLSCCCSSNHRLICAP